MNLIYLSCLTCSYICLEWNIDKHLSISINSCHIVNNSVNVMIDLLWVIPWVHVGILNSFLLSLLSLVKHFKVVWLCYLLLQRLGHYCSIVQRGESILPWVKMRASFRSVCTCFNFRNHVCLCCSLWSGSSSVGHVYEKTARSETEIPKKLQPWQRTPAWNYGRIVKTCPRHDWKSYSCRHFSFALPKGNYRISGEESNGTTHEKTP